jgi:2-polyprenyl-3-methyl-5-hydroxy-6-metoxy-1,4-benzoquinol methylase
MQQSPEAFSSWRVSMKEREACGAMDHKQLREANRFSWNEAIQARNRHKGDEVKFFCEGGNVLDPEEHALLGDITGLSIVHLQCNCGEETLSLTQLGAVVTGVEISDRAIDTARVLSLACGIPATFHRMDVYDWLKQVAQEPQRFDVVFCSYGSVIWLSDLTAWAKGIAAILKPDGRFVLMEIHPVLLMFAHDWTLTFPYSSLGTVLLFEEGMGDIVKHPGGRTEDVEAFTNAAPMYEFAWGIGDIVTALLQAGLTLTALKEYQFTHDTGGYERMQQISAGRWLPPEGMPSLPLRYGISARKRSGCSVKESN